MLNKLGKWNTPPRPPQQKKWETHRRDIKVSCKRAGWHWIQVWQDRQLRQSNERQDQSQREQGNGLTKGESNYERSLELEESRFSLRGPVSRLELHVDCLRECTCYITHYITLHYTYLIIVRAQREVNSKLEELSVLSQRYTSLKGHQDRLATLYPAELILTSVGYLSVFLKSN